MKLENISNVNEKSFIKGAFVEWKTNEATGSGSITREPYMLDGKMFVDVLVDADIPDVKVPVEYLSILE